MAGTYNGTAWWGEAFFTCDDSVYSVYASSQDRVTQLCQKVAGAGKGHPRGARNDPRKCTPAVNDQEDNR